jgi:hypothetical protein
MHPSSSIFEGCKVTVNARPVCPRGELAVEQARRIAAAGRGRSLYSEVAAQ